MRCLAPSQLHAETTGVLFWHRCCKIDTVSQDALPNPITKRSGTAPQPQNPTSFEDFQIRSYAFCRVLCGICIDEIYTLTPAKNLCMSELSVKTKIKVWIRICLQSAKEELIMPMIAANTKTIVTILPKETSDHEHQSWSRLSIQRLQDAYRDDEPEYSSALLKTVNPDYERR